MPRRVLAASTGAAAVVLLVACASVDPSTEDTEVVESGATVEVVGTDQLTFRPDELTISAGLEVTLELTAASVEHDLVVEGAAELGSAEAGHPVDDPRDLHVAHASPGESATATFTIDRAGTYTVYCSVPGHRVAGMVASLQVNDALP